MSNMKAPKQEEMYVRSMHYKALRDMFREKKPNKWYIKSFGEKPSMWAYKTKLDAFKSKLPKTEQGLSEKEIQKKYPHYEKEVDTVYTWNKISVLETQRGNLLVKDIVGASSQAFFVCSACREVQHHSSLTKGRYGDICKECQLHINLDEQKVKNRWESDFQKIKDKKTIVIYGKSGRWKMNAPFCMGELLETEGIGEWGSEKEVFLMMDYVEMEQKSGTVRKFTNELLEKLTNM